MTPLQDNEIEELGVFLRSGLSGSSDAAFAASEVLRWKYFEPGGTSRGPRSLIVREDGRMSAHIGIWYSEFVLSDGSARRIPTLHVIDWLASGTKSFQGLTLLLQTYRMTETQYVFGCTPTAERVLLGTGYRTLTNVQLFQKVLRKTAWKQIHAGQPLHKKILLLSIDRARTVIGRRRPLAAPVAMRRVEQFGPEIDAVLAACPMKQIYTSRAPDLLNHLLRYPLRTFSGWLIGNGEHLCGFGLLNVVTHGLLRVGKIVECFLNDPDEQLWQAAVHALSEELRKQGSDMVIGYGSTPWMARALKSDGFFPRGSTPLLIRDPKNLIPRDMQLHLTHLEADTSIL